MSTINLTNGQHIETIEYNGDVYLLAQDHTGNPTNYTKMPGTLSVVVSPEKVASDGNQTVTLDDGVYIYNNTGNNYTKCIGRPRTTSR